jgi:hypothetical protein
MDWGRYPTVEYFGDNQMKTIYKYPVHIQSGQFISLPQGAEILDIQKQHQSWQLWAMVETDQTTFCTYKVSVVPTGIELTNEHRVEHRDYVCTRLDGPMVWHWFITRVK